MIKRLIVIGGDNDVHRECLVTVQQTRSADPGILYGLKLSHFQTTLEKSLSLAIPLDAKKSMFSDFKKSLFELYFGGGAVCFPKRHMSLHHRDL